jgi:hypothetical protein
MQTTEHIVISGKSVAVRSIKVGQTIVVVTGPFLRIAAVKDEAHQEEVTEPEKIIAAIRGSDLKADLFTFAQKVPHTEPLYDYNFEMDELAVIRVLSYDDWWNNKIHNDARRMVRKAIKAGVQAKSVPFGDEIIRGIKEIWDESPFRQGRPFFNYNKSLEEVRALNSTYSDRSEFIGAYWEGEIIGFAKLFYTGQRADFVQILSKTKYRDKAPTNALLAKAVEICAAKGIGYLGYARFTYGKKGPDSLSDWKSRNGCELVRVPRYYIPLTLKGRIALKWGLHKGLVQVLPGPLVRATLRLRAALYSLRDRSRATN